MSLGNPFSSADTLVDDGALVASPCKSARNTFAVVRVSGEEAIDFLHGQFSADLRALSAGHTLVTAWCSPKGRVLFMPRLVRGADQDLYALLPMAQCAAFIKRLRMFVLRAKVLIEDCSTSHGVLVIDGGDAPAPEIELSMAVDGERRWVIGPRSALAHRWDAIALPTQSEHAAAIADIARGEFMLDATLSDAFLPQELNLDVVHGVSFNKGCYPGQEIVARVKFRGTVKRRVRRVTMVANSAPHVGARLLDVDHTPRGTVLVSAALAPGRYAALAVIDVDAGALHLAEHSESIIELQPLPYAVPDA